MATNPWDVPGMAESIDKYWNTSEIETAWYRKLQVYLKEVLLPGTILEVGCGSGKVHALLGDRPYVGVDISNNMLELHRKAFTDSQLFKVEPYMLPFDNTSFDNILCVSVLQHVEYPDRLLTELCRVANKKLILITWAGMAGSIAGKDTDGFYQNIYNAYELARKLHSIRTSVHSIIDNVYMRNWAFCFEYVMRDGKSNHTDPSEQAVLSA